MCQLDLGIMLETNFVIFCEKMEGTNYIFISVQILPELYPLPQSARPRLQPASGPFHHRAEQGSDSDSQNFNKITLIQVQLELARRRSALGELGREQLVAQVELLAPRSTLDMLSTAIF